MAPQQPDMRQIRHDLASQDQEIRGRAMQELYMAVKRSDRHHREALPLFVSAVSEPRDSWTVASAARGIETIAGPEAGRRAWTSLLNDQNAEIAHGAALSMTDVIYFDELMHALASRKEPRVINALVRTLGRMQKREAFEAIVRKLDDPDTRPDAIQALGELGDARGIRELERFLDDDTELWREDNHGPMLRVRELALDNIGMIRSRGPAF